MGFGHRVYKNYDPRAKLMRETCHEVLEELGLHDDRLFKLALQLEKIALEDEYFVERKLYPNVDFYSGIVQRALGIPTSMFTCIFSLARTVGWIAQWNEMISDPDQKIGRPRQLYTGAARRDVVPHRPSADRRSAQLQGSIMMKELLIELLPLRRQRAVRRGALRVLPQQPAVGARAVARLLRQAPGAARRRRRRRARRRARAGRGGVRAAGEAGRRYARRAAPTEPGAERQAGRRPAADQRLPVHGHALGGRSIR